MGLMIELRWGEAPAEPKLFRGPIYTKLGRSAEMIRARQEPRPTGNALTYLESVIFRTITRSAVRS